MNEIFMKVATQFQSNSEYDKFIKQVGQSSSYDLRVYRLQEITLAYAKSVYLDLVKKYENGVNQINAIHWYENERRLYVWFVVCYIRMKSYKAQTFAQEAETVWEELSDIFFHKSILFLKYQFMNILKNAKRAQWVDQEIKLLKAALQKYPKGEWNQVAKFIYFQSAGQCFKNPKQCSERWMNHENYLIKKGEWKISQDFKIIQFVKENGNKWSQIGQQLQYERTQHMIKNRYKSLLNKKKAELNLSDEQALNQLYDHYNKIKNLPDYLPIDEVDSVILQEGSSQLLEENQSIKKENTRNKKAEKKKEVPSKRNKQMTKVEQECKEKDLEEFKSIRPRQGRHEPEGKDLKGKRNLSIIQSDNEGGTYIDGCLLNPILEKSLPINNNIIIFSNHQHPTHNFFASDYSNKSNLFKVESQLNFGNLNSIFQCGASIQNSLQIQQKCNILKSSLDFESESKKSAEVGKFFESYDSSIMKDS